MLATKIGQSEDGGWKMENGSSRRRAIFHLPSSVFHLHFLLFLVAALLISGCTPSGPRALLKGKKLLERGDYANAVEKLKTATSLLATNAQAWNYLGVACQYAGRPTEAVTAYQRALALDRDLMEAHYNLGCLWLEQGKPDAAGNEFTAYTLRRSKAPEGWLKLGLAQLQARDLAAAEKSFSTVRYLNPKSAEALNGFGLACVQRGNPRDAMQFFAAAAKEKPDFGPALLNLATVAQQYLHNNALALQNYRAYLALTPHQANWDAVNDIANGLEPQATAATASEMPASGPESRLPITVSVPHAPAGSRTQAVARATLNPPRQATGTAQVVKVPPEPVIVGTPVAADSAPGKTGALNRLNPLNWFRSSEPESNPPPAAVPRPTPTTAPRPPAPVANNSRVGITPLPSANSSSAVSTASVAAPVVPAKPVKIAQPASPTFPRYLYLSPRKPKAGDRRTASNAFTQARAAEQEARLADALEAYHQATESDPSWFQAQYNYGVIAYRLRNYSQSLAAYEMALAIQPDSADARFNFALGLRSAGYVTDAVNELKTILEDHPDETRVHLALGNIYAQQMYDPADARQHYLKVLQLEPRNPHASDIQFWLSSNPP